MSGESAAVGVFGDLSEWCEPRNRQPGYLSQGFEGPEGTSSTSFAPCCQIRSCTVASADNTANTTRIFTSTGMFVRRDLATRLPFRLVPRIVNAGPLPESLTQENS